MPALIELKLMPLLAVFVLAAIATTVAQLVPTARKVVPLALLLDLIPLAGVIAATVIATIRLKHAFLPLSRLIVIVYGYFAGALVGTFGLVHLVAVVIAAIERARHDQFVYDFRFYSLVQLGVFLVAAGIIAAIQASNLARGDRVAWRASLLVWTTILAINLPLVPIQGFAIVFSVLAALELLLLVIMRLQVAVRRPGDT